MNDYIFTLVNVSKSFKLPLRSLLTHREIVRALDSVSFSIPREKTTCLLGPNGAGKTTLIKIIASLITPDSGSIQFGDASTGQTVYADPGTIGLVTPNDRSFYWRLTGRQNLMFFGSLYNLRGKILRDRVEQAMVSVGILEKADTTYQLYSAGTKQKMNIARSLLGDPELYLLDEPAAHLDPVAREAFRNFIIDVLIKIRHATVLLCTHDLEEARILADHIIILDSGKVIANGSPVELHAMMENHENLILKYSGKLPESWLAMMGSRVSRISDGSLRIILDESLMSKELLIRSFIENGGSLRELYAQSDGLLELLHGRTGQHV
jgi:ABC-2 type transport system ATP-binding protein